ncbi:nucleotidyltransferase family protein [Roseateles terrae]|uniref:Molybdenum cofactor cytidylyltransferase n=1 Tax=Roseateles terrae TaxID=431060 RepID=A0ABR6GLN4_9BURK|nr:nucleotidyltransferase family protein [Roseateles terrae]MBB3193014.1 molybdenum cofactor cytidylyltransferase [Roseateles terrae]OWQ89742.1 molybdopterin-guanine dinucleotide biosynthesis protein MobA [Roseateles terrae]
MDQRRPAVVVLAAGRGQRFRGEGHKLEQLVGGETVLAHTLRQTMASGLRYLVVTSTALAPLVRRHVAERDMLVLPTQDRLGRPAPVGMGHSIAAGVAATGDAQGWLIVPADMPLLQTSTLLAVARALEHDPIAYAQYDGQRGHPVGFSAELFSELTALQGDEGARKLLARFPAQAVDVNDPGVLVDVDTVEDLARVVSVHPAVPVPASARHRLRPSESV